MNSFCWLFFVLDNFRIDFFSTTFSFSRQRGKNKELEAKVNEVEKRYADEKSTREDCEGKIVLLKKRLKDMMEKESARTNTADGVDVSNIMSVDSSNQAKGNQDEEESNLIVTTGQLHVS